VQLPQQLSDEERALWEKLSRVSRAEVKEKLEFVLAETVDEVLAAALENPILEPVKTR